MRPKHLFLLSLIIIFSGCASWSVPDTLGDPKNAQSFGYHPIDPLPVNLNVTGSGSPDNERLLKALPDETMRLAIGKIEGNGGITYGPAQAGYKGSSYVVVVDYIKFNTRSFGVKLEDSADAEVKTKFASLAPNPAEADVIVPVYIGVGLRLTANITVNEGSVNLGSLFALGVAAQSKKVSGTLVVQTLGLSGESISTIIPMPSEINASTIQNALLALGAIKAKMYDTGTIVTPRVVGVYNNLGGGEKTINGFISSMLQKPQILDIP